MPDAGERFRFFRPQHESNGHEVRPVASVRSFVAPVRRCLKTGIAGGRFGEGGMVGGSFRAAQRYRHKKFRLSTDTGSLVGTGRGGCFRAPAAE